MKKVRSANNCNLSFAVLGSTIRESILTDLDVISNTLKENDEKAIAGLVGGMTLKYIKLIPHLPEFLVLYKKFEGIPPDYYGLYATFDLYSVKGALESCLLWL